MVATGYLNHHCGNLDAALAEFEALVQAGRARGDRQTTGWGLLGVSRVRLAQGLPGDAIAALEQAMPLVADRVSSIELHGQMALAQFRRGSFERSHT